MKARPPLKFLTFTLLWFAVFPANAYAYLDPGTGSYVLQVLVGIFLGGIFTIKVFWGNIKKSILNFVSKRKKD